MARAWTWLLWCALGAVGVAAGCGGSPPGEAKPVAQKEGKKAAAADFDPCEGNRPPPKDYEGILRKARCDQDMYLTMASVSTQLGVECTFCHVPDKGGDPKALDYPAATQRKLVANWMSQHMMSSIKRKDGEPMRCKSCHVDEDGKPLRKILGEPRDLKKAQEWMALVMVNRFTKLDGSKLKCKDCHGGNYGTPEWRGEVILTDDRLPEHPIGDASF